MPALPPITTTVCPRSPRSGWMGEVLVAMLMIPPFNSLELRIRYIRAVIERPESAGYKAGISEMTSPKVGTRPPSTLRIARCEPEAKDLPLSGAGAASPRHRFPECGRRWRPRAS